MTIKKILVLPTGGEADTAALFSAYRVAQDFTAHIDVTFVKTTTPPIYSTGYEGLAISVGGEFLDQYEADLNQLEERVHAAFKEFVAANQIVLSDDPGIRDRVTASWSVIEGRAPAVVAEHGGAYDLIVLGRPMDDLPDVATPTIETALFATGRPALIAPTEILDKIGETVLIAWNRGAQAARAFHAAKALLLERATKVRILSITTGAKEGPSAEAIADNLAWHGIDADIRELSPDYRSVGEVILAEASAIGADMVVMGAYSHSRLRQMILGGVTSHVLGNAPIAVFMAH